MLAFARASTGIKGLDRVLDDLRWGDNVVWQVEQIEDYRNMVNPFVAQCLADHRRVVYMRFGQHPPILQPHPRIMEYQLDANLGFEAFSSRVHSIALSLIHI